MNLAVNARDAMPGGGRLCIETGVVEHNERSARLHAVRRPGSWVVLTVSDEGAGIDEAIRCQIFEPFFTTKKSGTGTGLGLSMTQGIIEQSGGYIEVDSTPGRGATFRIFLPAVTDALADPRSKQERLGAPFRVIETARETANAIKREWPVTVVIGNPPHVQNAKGRADWIEGPRKTPLIPGQKLSRPSLDEFRADTARNMDAWYPAFDVKVGEKLYLAPADRVRIW